MESNLTRADILYQNQRANPSPGRFVPDSVNGCLTGVSIVDSSLVETIQPINPVTGWRDNSISRLMSPNTPNVERELILKSLSKMKGYNSPKELTDDDLLEILPSRYSNDPVELERFKEFVDSLQSPVEPAPDVSAHTEPASSEPAE